jgi:sec-independent protein translocase protein TatA
MFEGLFQPTHLFLILAVALLVFGPSKLPDIGAGLGKSIRDFKKAMAEADEAPPAARAKELPAPPEAVAMIAADATETKKA